MLPTLRITGLGLPATENVIIVLFLGCWCTHRCIAGTPISLLHGIKGYNLSIHIYPLFKPHNLFMPCLTGMFSAA